MEAELAVASRGLGGEARAVVENETRPQRRSDLTERIAMMDRVRCLVGDGQITTAFVG